VFYQGSEQKNGGIKVNKEGKVHPKTVPEGPEGSRGIALLFL